MGQSYETSGLDENVPHRLLYLKTWSPLGGTVPDGLGCVAVSFEDSKGSFDSQGSSFVSHSWIKM